MKRAWCQGGGRLVHQQSFRGTPPPLVTCPECRKRFKPVVREGGHSLPQHKRD